MALHHAGAKPEADSGGWAVNAGRHIEAVEQPGLSAAHYFRMNQE
jgi:hypothetical protein